MKPTIGRIVLVGTLDKYQKPCVLPAIIVKVWSDICVNVVVFNDGTNDLDITQDSIGRIKWMTSVVLDTNEEVPSSMHWIWPPKI